MTRHKVVHDPVPKRLSFFRYGNLFFLACIGICRVVAALFLVRWFSGAEVLEYQAKPHQEKRLREGIVIRRGRSKAARQQQGSSKAAARQQQGSSKAAARQQQGSSKAAARQQQGSSKAAAKRRAARQQQGSSNAVATQQKQQQNSSKRSNHK